MPARDLGSAAFPDADFFREYSANLKWSVSAFTDGSPTHSAECPGCPVKEPGPGASEQAWAAFFADRDLWLARQLADLARALVARAEHLEQIQNTEN